MENIVAQHRQDARSLAFFELQTSEALLEVTRIREFFYKGLNYSAPDPDIYCLMEEEFKAIDGGSLSDGGLTDALCGVITSEKPERITDAEREMFGKLHGLFSRLFNAIGGEYTPGTTEPRKDLMAKSLTNASAAGDLRKLGYLSQLAGALENLKALSKPALTP